MERRRSRRLMEKVSKEGVAPATEAGGRSQIEELPPEILQMIFKQVGSKAELTPLRFACKRWNSNALAVIGQWTQPWGLLDWRPEESITNLALRRLPAPKIIVVVTLSRLIVKVVSSSGSTIRGIKPSTMYFPTKSLTLEIQGKSQSLESKWSPKVTLKDFFGNSGTSLKSLCIVDMETHGTCMRELNDLLSQTRELRVLKIFQNYNYCCWGTPPLAISKTSPILPYLESLTLDAVKDYTCKWLLETVAQHLVTLELGGKYYFNWDAEKNPKGLPALRNLKLNNYSDIFSGVLIPNLTRLSIFLLYWESEEKLIQFISRFQTTLIELTVEPSHRFSEENTDEFRHLTFPKLTKLCLTCTMSVEQRSQFERKLFLASFPKLEVLRLRNGLDMSEEEARAYSNNYGHWDTFPSLKTIEWITDLFLYREVETHTLIRPE